MALPRGKAESAKLINPRVFDSGIAITQHGVAVTATHPPFAVSFEAKAHVRIVVGIPTAYLPLIIHHSSLIISS
jgi:hypothetical protein